MSLLLLLLLSSVVAAVVAVVFVVAVIYQFSHVFFLLFIFALWPLTDSTMEKTN